MDNFAHHVLESFNRSIKCEKGSDSQFMIGPLKLLGPCQQNFTIVSFRTSTFKSCKELMSTSNTLTDSKSVETLKTHTQAYMVQTIVTHSTIRLEGNNLKQTDPLECGAEIKFSGSVSGETMKQFIPKMEKWQKHFFKQAFGW
jgi:hypothetical protein